MKANPVSWPVLFLGVMATTSLQAFPQFVKDGYFSCSSCHVSTGGGDALTAYGRGIAAEKLAMWAEEGEGTATFGAKELPAWLLLGAHIRWVQVTSDSGTQRYADNFWMQRDLNLGLTTEFVTAYATFSPLPLSKAVVGTEESYGVRKWLARSQFTENLSTAIGVFYPKYGLMIGDHNAYIRNRLGFGAGAEKGAAEVAWTAESFEITFTSEVGALAQLPNSDPAIDGWESAYYLSGALFAAEKHRVGLNVARKVDGRDRLESFGPHATLSIVKGLTVSTEADWMTRSAPSVTTTSLATYLDSTLEATKGVWLQLVHEVSLSDVEDLRSKQEKQSVKILYFPRPHVDMKLSIGQTKDHRDYTFSNFGSFIIHFWL